MLRRVSRTARQIFINRTLLLAALLQVAVLTGAWSQSARVAMGNKIMIAAHPVAAQAGLEVFRKGGNVVDAAVAATYCLGVVESYGSGVGGEGMMVIYQARTKTYTVIDFKGISASQASYKTFDFSSVGSWNRSPKAAVVPGAVAGLELAREKFGRLNRTMDLQPAIDFAEKGFEVDSTLALNLKYYRKMLEKDAYARQIYYPGDTIPVVGTLLRNPDYAATLKEIQRGGATAFYEGKIAELIVRDAERHGGLISAADLKAYQALERKPLRGSYRGFEVVTTPPPCGGMHLIEALNILKYFDVKQAAFYKGYDLHLLAETFKLVYKDEAAHNGDPAFHPIPAETIISPDYAFQRMLEIRLGTARHPQQVKPGHVDEQSTTHLSAMDAEGNTVTLTITLSSLFGTGHTVEGAGFMMNNEMQNFNPDSLHPNGLQPHKRVVTSLIPTILAKNGQPVYALGTPGGDLIISTVTQVIVNLLDLGMDLPGAVDSPRIFSTFYQRALEMENRFPPQTDSLLKSLGHDLREEKPYQAYFGAVQAVERNPATGRLVGVSDPRRSGGPAGE